MYKYQYTDPDGRTTYIDVHSARDVGPSKIHITPDGEVIIETEGLTPGPNNTAQALTIIDGLVKASGKVALPLL